MKISQIAAAAFALAWSGSAFAQGQDRCADVLSGGTMSRLEVQESDYYHMYLWSELSRMDYRTASTQRAAGGAIPIGEVVLGANFTEDDLESFRRNFRSSTIREVTQTRSRDLLLMAGDEEVLRRWSECMQARRGGLDVRFEIPDITSPEVTLVLQYYSEAAGLNEVVIDQPINLPNGVMVREGDECLRVGRVLRNLAPCRVTLNIADAMQTFAVNVNTSQGGAGVYFPRRLVRDEEFRAFDFSREPNLSFRGNKTQATRSNVVTLYPELRQEGWRFDPDSAAFRVTQTRTHRGGRCQRVQSRATEMRFEYSYFINAPERNRARSAAVTCRARASIDMRRMVWTPAVILEGTQTPE